MELPICNTGDNPLELASATSEQTPPTSTDDPETVQGADPLHSILAAIQAQSVPANLPPIWDLPAKRTSLYMLKCTADELETSLQQKFPLEQLLAANVFEASDDTAPRLNSVFVGSMPLMFGSRAGKVFEVISAHRGLSFREPPSIHYGAARHAEVGQPSGRLLLAASDDDVDVLRRLGFAGVWANGLQNMRKVEVRQIFDPPNATKPPHEFKLILVGWHVAALDGRMPQLIHQILNRLIDCKKLYKTDLKTRFGVWRPTSEQIAQIKLAAQFGDQQLVQNFVEQSIKTLYDPGETLAMMQPPVELSYAHALANLKKALGRSQVIPRAQEIQAAAEKFSLVFEKTVLQGFYKTAAAAELIEAILTLAAAELAAHWFDTQEILKAARRVTSMGRPQIYSMDDSALDDRLRLVSALIKILQSISRFKK